MSLVKNEDFSLKEIRYARANKGPGYLRGLTFDFPGYSCPPEEYYKTCGLNENGDHSHTVFKDEKTSLGLTEKNINLEKLDFVFHYPD